jgi:hypothetical protein
MRDDVNDYYFVNAFHIRYIEGTVSHMTNEMFYKALENQAVKKLRYCIQ